MQNKNIHRDCISLSICFSLALTPFLSFSCPLVSPLVSLCLKSLSLSLSAKWLPLLYHTHMLKHGSAMTLQCFPIPALNCTLVPHSLERESHIHPSYLSSLCPQSNLLWCQGRTHVVQIWDLLATIDMGLFFKEKD